MNALKNSLRTFVALVTLLVCLSSIQGSAQVSEEKVMQLRKAAEQGDAGAQTNLGACYGNGWGVPQDYGQAVKWYRLAAAQGVAKAQSNLGVCYDRGYGVPQDDVMALKWFNTAIESGGFEEAKTFKAKLLERMTPEQIAEAQKLSR